MKINFIKVVFFSLPLLLASQASGAVITWDPSGAHNVDTSLESQVSTVGNLLAAVDINSGSGFANHPYTVNGVTFTASNPHVTIDYYNALILGYAPGTGDPTASNPA